jgi:cytochrome c556
MRCLCWTLVSTAVVMTLSTGTSGASPSQRAAAKMTEQDYEAIMKKVGPAYVSMRKNLDGGEVTPAAKAAQQLAQLFGEAEKFWAQHNKRDAVKFAQTARTYATQIAGDLAAAEGFLRLDPRVQRGIQLRLKSASTAATNMGAMCKQCHGTYREGDEATGFRIKPGALAR